MSDSLLETFLTNVKTYPEGDFLTEEKNVSLSYKHAYIVAVKLLPARFHELHPILATISRPKIVIISHNNSLVPLSILALWTMSAKVIQLSTSADPSLWSGMINLVEPDLILISSSLHRSLTTSLEGFSLATKYSSVLDISSLIPETHSTHVTAQSQNRISNYIPSLRSWVNWACLDLKTSEEEILQSTSLLPIGAEIPAITLFTSSAVDWQSLKCVTYTHGMLAHSARRAMLMLGGLDYSSEPKRHLGWLPLSHCFEFCITFCGVVIQTGGTYVFFDRFVSSPELPPTVTIAALLLASLKYYDNITATAMTPAIFGDVLALCGNDDILRLQALSSLGIGGASTVEAVFQWAASRNIPYFDCSGATEAAGTMALRRARDSFQRESGLQVIPEVMGLLEKEKLSDYHGELVIQSTHLPTGYDFRESTSYSFDPSTGVTTYRTGDLYSHCEHVPAPSYLAGGKVPEYDASAPSLSGLTYVGRIDDMVIFESGVKIDALSLERVLDTGGLNIQRSAILSNVSGNALIALILPHPHTPSIATTQSLIDSVLELNASIPFEKRLRREYIFIVKDLPVTTKQTLNRKQLKKMLKGIEKDEDIPRLFPPPPAVTDDTVEAKSVSPSTQVPQELRKRLVGLLSEIYSVPEQYFAAQNASLANVPLTSLSAVQLAQALKDKFSTEITAAQLYGAHTMDDLYALIATSSSLQSINSTVSVGQLNKGSTVTAKNEFCGVIAPEIGITGGACRFVGGIDSFDSYWSALLAPDSFLKNLRRNRPESRWGKENGKAHSDSFVSMGWLEESAIDNLKSFSNFFGLSPMEAGTMSPNARLALQLGYLAIEDACIAPRSLSGRNWGIFTCVNDSGWREHRLETSDLEEYGIGVHGSSDDAVGARLSYFLNLTGPSMEIKTACSSSAVAIHLACSAIRNGDCDAAIVISSTTHFHPAGAIFRSHSGIVSPSGICAPFSEKADGFVASEGACAIVLQRVSEAEVSPYGCVMSSAITQDGTSRGFFAPNPKAQTRLFREVLSKASLTPDQVTFLEAHGTGTQLGDSIELQSIMDVFGESGATRPLYIGSSKAVIGHTEECAGLAGVLKVLMCLNHNAIPPQPKSGPLNNTLLLSSQLKIPKTIGAFLPTDSRRICSVSSFGLSGTLANIVIGEAIDPVKFPPFSSPTKAFQIFLISTSSHDDLALMVNRYLEFFENQHLTHSELEASTRTSQLARDSFPIRAAWAVRTGPDLIRGLRQFVPKKSLSPVPVRSPCVPRIGIWFGLPFVPMESSNYHPLYQSVLSETFNVEWHDMYASLRDQVVIARCLSELGCEISAVGGAGIAEYAAAVFAGTIPVQAVFRVAERKTDISTHTVRGPESEIKEHLMVWRSDQLRIIDQLSSNLFTITGNPKCVEEFSQKSNVEVGMSHPTATILMPIGSFRPSFVPIISAHTGSTLADETLTNFNYWNGAQHRDCDSVTALKALKSQCDVIVDLSLVEGLGEEVGPFITAHENSLERLVALLFENGCSITWNKFSQRGPLTRLPGYSWCPDT